MVDSISPWLGTTLSRFSRSRKMMPGSPVCQAEVTMASKTARALCWPTTRPVAGSTRS